MKTNSASILFLTTFFLILNFHSHSQIITKTYFDGIKDTRILNKIKNSKEYLINSSAEFKQLKLNSLKGNIVDSSLVYKFADGQSLNYDFIKNARQTIEQDKIVYSLKIKVEDAYNLSLQL